MAKFGLIDFDDSILDSGYSRCDLHGLVERSVAVLKGLPGSEVIAYRTGAYDESRQNHDMYYAKPCVGAGGELGLQASREFNR